MWSVTQKYRRVRLTSYTLHNCQILKFGMSMKMSIIQCTGTHLRNSLERWIQWLTSDRSRIHSRLLRPCVHDKQDPYPTVRCQKMFKVEHAWNILLLKIRWWRSCRNSSLLLFRCLPNLLLFLMDRTTRGRWAVHSQEHLSAEQSVWCPPLTANLERGHHVRRKSLMQR